MPGQLFDFSATDPEKIVLTVYRQGFENGAEHKAQEVKAVLGILQL